MVSTRVHRPWLRRSAAVAGILSTVVVAAITHLSVLFYASWDCGPGWDTDSEPLAAPASPQGWLCSTEAPVAGQVVWFGAFLASLVATVAIVVLAWRRASWPGGLLALVLVSVIAPLITALVLNLAPDDCSSHARATHPKWACARE